MPRAWSAKDERMYEHVKESEEDRGSSRAEEIAARTVNKQRSKEGRTKEQRSKSGRTKARRGEAGGKTRQELYAEAKRLNIEGRSKMNKEELARAVGRKAA